ncbi:hypothetical protein PanWU01x14_126230, partial [Parasponia andersonii]
AQTEQSRLRDQNEEKATFNHTIAGPNVLWNHPYLGLQHLLMNVFDLDNCPTNNKESYNIWEITILKEINTK